MLVEAVTTKVPLYPDGLIFSIVTVVPTGTVPDPEGYVIVTVVPLPVAPVTLIFSKPTDKVTHSAVPALTCIDALYFP